MFNNLKVKVLALVFVLGALVVACSSPEPEIVEVVREVVVTTVVEKEVEVQGETVVVTQIVEKEVEVVVVETVEVEAGGDGEMMEDGAMGEPQDYIIGIFEDPTTLNHWAQLGPDNTVWTSYANIGRYLSLYSLAPPGNQWVPVLAKDIKTEFVEEDEGVSLTVEMIEGATWSDGEPVDANDVVFTFNTALDLNLTGNWPTVVAADVVTAVEAVDDYTVKFYFSDVPGLAQWQFGASGAGILAEHEWAATVEEARAFVDGVELPEDCSDEAPEEDLVACEAFTNARTTLYGADLGSYLTAGSLSVDKFEPGAFVAKTPNKDTFFAGAQYIQTSDGSYTEIWADGSERSFYGDGSGDETVNYVSGPYAPNVILSIYGDQDSAYLALIDGEIDYVLNPLSASQGTIKTAQEGGARVITNADNGVFYFAFNMRKAPFSDLAFRTAVDVLVDKEFITGRILQNTVFPTYSVVPTGNTSWFSPLDREPLTGTMLGKNDDGEDVFSADAIPSSEELLSGKYTWVGMTREERVEVSKKILLDAGYSWTTEPFWDEARQDVTPGEGFSLPDGTAMEKAVILGPGPSYDPQRATFNTWISEYMREMGMPVESELTGFNTILDPVFVEASFDMYILGWGLSLYPDYLCDFFDSRNDTATTGNYNTPGHNDAEFDALCDEFKAETDIEAAIEQAKKLQDILATNLPYIPLFNRQSIDVISANVKLPYTDALGGLADSAGFQSDAIVSK